MILFVFITVISGHDKPQPPGCLLGLNYRVSTADLKMMYAPKFAAGEVFGLQEASGMKGVLFRAKDAIKAKFGARWLPAKAKNSDFPGNWWIIETKHNVADVLAVIQQYA
ncbi:hypothetical protein HDN28_004770 [Escherichia coli]|nr:hypothetical protein [Escherichia coli]